MELQSTEEIKGSWLLATGLERIRASLAHGCPDTRMQLTGGDQFSWAPEVFVARALAGYCAETVRDVIDRSIPDGIDTASVIDQQSLQAELQELIEPMLAHLAANFALTNRRMGADTSDFLAYLGHSGLATALTEYPALTYVLSARMETWVRSATAAARGAFQVASTDMRTLLGSGPIGRILRLASSGGDVHDGKEGMIVTLSRGGLVYKPRDLRMEILVGEFVRLAGLAVQIPPTITAGTVGWARFENEASNWAAPNVEQLYRSLGHVLALSHVLGLRDLHAENVLLGPDRLILIDLEVACVFEDGVSGYVPFDLLSSHLLPSDREPPQGSSGRAHVPRGSVTALAKLIEATGDRDLSRRGSTVVRGFREAVRALHERAGLLIGLLERASSYQIRHVLRPTDEYARVLREVRPVDSLGGLKSRIDRLRLYFRSTPEQWQPLVPGEVKALARGEFPRITARANSRTLECQGHMANDVLTRGGLEVAIDRMVNLQSAGELQSSIAAIRRAFK